MSRALLIIRTAADRARAVSWVKKAPRGTRLEFKEQKRSLDQNSRLWAMLTEVARQLPWHGVKLRPDDWKFIFLDALKRELRVVPNLDGTGFVNLGRSSSELSKEEMGDLLTLIESFGASHGVIFNDPMGGSVTRRELFDALATERAAREEAEANRNSDLQTYHAECERLRAELIDARAAKERAEVRAHREWQRAEDALIAQEHAEVLRDIAIRAKERTEEERDQYKKNAETFGVITTRAEAEVARLTSALAGARAEERERCARHIEDRFGKDAAFFIAAAIRSLATPTTEPAKAEEEQ